MKATNADVFAILSRFCELRSEPIKNPSAARWIRTHDHSQREILIHAKRSDIVAFSPARAIIKMDQGSVGFVCTVGFEHVEAPVGYTELELNAGLLTAVLAEVKPKPRATPSQIKNVLDLANKVDDPAYNGHEAAQISELFAPQRFFSCSTMSAEDTWRTFFLLCVEECSRGESWINDELADTLRLICSIELISIPYRTLCRSIFDSDPSAMFLALYRCLESLYSYSGAQKIISALRLKNEWGEVAKVLEDKLSWYPREETSLSDLLKKANTFDLKEVFLSSQEPLPDDKTDLALAAGRRIYRLRNGLVHFRPLHQTDDFSDFDWNRFCNVVAILVWDIYTDVFLTGRLASE